MKRKNYTINPKRKLYLAYGSNLSEEQMAYRCPDATIVGRAVVNDYELLFKGSKTGSYATIEPKKGGKVPVLVWSITPKDEARLDMYEGFPTFYYKKDLQVEIESLDQEPLGAEKAMVYIMDEKRPFGIPSKLYYGVLHNGYKDFGFDLEILEHGLMKSCKAMYKGTAPKKEVL